MFFKVTSCKQIERITYRTLAEVIEVVRKHPFGFFTPIKLFSLPFCTLSFRTWHSQLLGSQSTLLKTNFC